MMLKIIASICFIITGALCGVLISDRLKLKMEICREIQGLLIQFSGLIHYRGLDVYEIIYEAKRSGAYAHLDFLEQLPENPEPENNFHEIWSETIMASESIGNEEKNLMLSFGKRFGTSDIDGQLAEIEAALQEISAIKICREEEYHQKGRLYRSMGMLAGTMIGIIVI